MSNNGVGSAEGATDDDPRHPQLAEVPLPDLGMTARTAAGDGNSILSSAGHSLRSRQSCGADDIACGRRHYTIAAHPQRRMATSPAGPIA